MTDKLLTVACFILIAGTISYIWWSVASMIDDIKSERRKWEEEDRKEREDW